MPILPMATSPNPSKKSWQNNVICLFSESRKHIYQFEQINTVWTRERGSQGQAWHLCLLLDPGGGTWEPGPIVTYRSHGSLPSTAGSTPGSPQTARLLGRGETSRKVSVLGPKMTGEAKANPGTPCQVLDQSVLDLSLCTIAWVNVLVKLKANHGLSPRSSDGHSLSQYYLKSAPSRDECPTCT